eukprot:Opistho-2@7174
MGKTRRPSPGTESPCPLFVSTSLSPLSFCLYLLLCHLLFCFFGPLPLSISAGIPGTFALVLYLSGSLFVTSVAMLSTRMHLNAYSWAMLLAFNYLCNFHSFL